MPSEVPLTCYLDAVNRSSRRGRNVLALLIFATVLQFAAFWNTLPISWGGARLAAMQNAIRWVNFEGDSTTLSEESLGQWRAAQTYMSLAGHPDSIRLARDLEAMMAIRNNRIRVISVPALGIIVDVNDLSVFGGFAILVLLIWFRYSLTREYANVRLALSEATDRESLVDAYQVLAMDQVLTVPKLPESEGGGWLNHNLPRFLFVLPFMSQMAVFGFDLMSYEVGLALSWVSMGITYLAAAILTAAIGLLTWQSVDLSRSIDSEWERWEQLVYDETSGEVLRSPVPAS